MKPLILGIRCNFDRFSARLPLRVMLVMNVCICGKGSELIARSCKFCCATRGLRFREIRGKEVLRSLRAVAELCIWVTYWWPKGARSVGENCVSISTFMWQKRYSANPISLYVPMYYRWRFEIGIRMTTKQYFSQFHESMQKVQVGLGKFAIKAH